MYLGRYRGSRLIDIGGSVFSKIILYSRENISDSGVQLKVLSRFFKFLGNISVFINYLAHFMETGSSSGCCRCFQ